MANSLARVLAQTVHISADPIPKSISQSKTILAAMQKFGEVVTFRNLKYDTTNTAPSHNRSSIAIFESPDAAARAIAASPLAIPLSSTTRETNEDETTPHTVYGRWHPFDLRLFIQKSRHNHLSALQRNPYYTTFDVDQDSYQYQDLVDSTSIPLPELADGIMRKKRYVPAGAKRKVESENEQFGATSLWRLYEQGKSAQEMEWVNDNDNDNNGESRLPRNKR